MKMHMDRKVIVSAAVAAAALGAIAFACKYKKGCIENFLASHRHTSDLDKFGSGQISPYDDTPTDPTTQN